MLSTRLGRRTHSVADLIANKGDSKGGVELNFLSKVGWLGR